MTQTQLDQIQGMLEKAMPMLEKVGEALPALAEFKEWHAEEAERIKAQLEADEQHDAAFQAWLKGRDEEEANRRAHAERIQPFLK